MAVTSARNSRVDELDGLRAILALWVVAAHILSWTGFYDLTTPRHLHLVWSQFVNGTAAVETFMILSGFAISFLLNQRPQGYQKFMIERFFRIFPVYFICLILGLLGSQFADSILQVASWKTTSYFKFVEMTQHSQTSHLIDHVMAHLILVHGLIPKGVLPYSTATILPPAWSITLEWQYYLVAPAIALAVRFRNGAGVLFLVLLALLGHHFGWAFANPHMAFLPLELPLFLVGIGSYHLYSEFYGSGQRPLAVIGIFLSTAIGFAVLSHWHTISFCLWALTFGCVLARPYNMPSPLNVLSRGLLHRGCNSSDVSRIRSTWFIGRSLKDCSTF